METKIKLTKIANFRWINKEAEEAYNRNAEQLIALQKEYDRRAKPILDRMAELATTYQIPNYYIIPSETKDFDSFS